ncbi:GNAT family N-acetyltransferase [Sunxiuqinia elliptica]|uniref:Putative acetyltransferase n=1 Tax=Sunxiuqinia elliptica TaxID=655355 RepID=A0A1I2MF75_9BACT|nr:GNAT family N-acetyltransferase [Sunxiuqinia elliptica]SFF89570.1 putative acetyltransferase [Sunxiuqinia elliptica]
MVNIREVKESDNPVLSQLIKCVFEEYDAPRDGTVYSDPTTDQLCDLFREERSILWVAELDEKIVGCCGIYPTPGLPDDCAELVKFYLSPEARGQGIGKSLMEINIRSAIDFGYSQLYIESLPEFDQAVRMYEKLGFSLLQKPLGDSGHTSCSVWMIKELAKKN